jgi:hypothetical protein
MIPTQIRSPSLVWSVSCDSSPFSGVLPWFHCGLIPSLASPIPPPLQLTINANTTNRGPRQFSRSCLVLLYQSSSRLVCLSLSVLAFCVYNLFHDPTLGNEFMSISSSNLTLHKKLRGRLSLRLNRFYNPKSFLDPNDL